MGWTGDSLDQEWSEVKRRGSGRRPGIEKKWWPYDRVTGNREVAEVVPASARELEGRRS